MVPPESLSGRVDPRADDAISFRRHVGIRVLEADQGVAHLVMPFHDPLGNRAGMVHGGAIASLVDAAISTALVSLLNDPKGGATVEMSIRYLTPPQGDLRAEARVLHRGGRMAFGQADVYDAKGTLVATGQGTYSIRRKPGGPSA